MSSPPRPPPSNQQHHNTINNTINNTLSFAEMETEMNRYRKQAEAMSDELFVLKTSEIADRVQEDTAKRDEIDELKAMLSTKEGEIRKLQMERSKHMREVAKIRRAEKERCQMAINRSRVSSSTRDRESGLPPSQSQHQSKRRRTSVISDLTSPGASSSLTSAQPPQPLNVSNDSTSGPRPQSSDNNSNSNNSNNNSSSGSKGSSNNGSQVRSFQERTTTTRASCPQYLQ